MSTYTDFVNFLKYYNRYRAEIFSVYSTFNKLSDGISFLFLSNRLVVYKQAYDISREDLIVHSHISDHPTPQVAFLRKESIHIRILNRFVFL